MRKGETWVSKSIVRWVNRDTEKVEENKRKISRQRKEEEYKEKNTNLKKDEKK